VSSNLKKSLQQMEIKALNGQIESLVHKKSSIAGDKSFFLWISTNCDKNKIKSNVLLVMLLQLLYIFF